MPYDEPSFLNGLAAGLTATVAPASRLKAAIIRYDIHIENSDTAYVNVAFPFGGNVSIDWGDGSPLEMFTVAPPLYSFGPSRLERSHAYRSGEYAVTLYSNSPMCPSHGRYSVRQAHGGVYAASDDAFQCKILRGASLLWNVPYIGEHAFCCCDKLQYIDIPASVTRIGNDAFYSYYEERASTVSRSIDVYYAGTEESWRAIRIDSENYALDRATFHFQTSAP